MLSPFRVRFTKSSPRIYTFATQSSPAPTRFAVIPVSNLPSSKNPLQFDTNKPQLLKQEFKDVPAIKKWFKPSKDGIKSHRLNTEYLKPFESTQVRLECTMGRENDPRKDFGEVELSLGDLFQNITDIRNGKRGRGEMVSIHFYLAQQSLDDLPQALQDDVPTPSFISQFGRGDKYGSSLWMGKPPTRTPLHRDPNPNIFIQLAGRKVVRLMAPDDGARLYHRITEVHGSANMRGTEMMSGPESLRLEEAVWGHSEVYDEVKGVEAELESGDGLYIPLGWWHAVNGVGQGVNASVNWWFR
ncbi:JmjC domain protein [Dendryphion nanum]|uniref:JmjC domain protein n=1 Tax=Dendryphion nanum TaxID=256645 RepID=A0A9P9ITL2_9PLEO|nr:JmjC domain protein [Dendryphion nanum]